MCEWQVASDCTIHTEAMSQMTLLQERTNAHAADIKELKQEHGNLVKENVQTNQDNSQGCDDAETRLAR